MSLVAYLILIAVTGLIVGALARLALPGRDPMTLPQTMLAGIGGSLLAGIVGAALHIRGFGFALAVLFATGIVYLVRRSRGGTLSEPGRRPDLRR
jgi:uncharacterized membrane protein YeaQ/YmgE (transglycosylase-associated protein family)